LPGDETSELPEEEHERHIVELSKEWSRPKPGDETSELTEEEYERHIVELSKEWSRPPKRNVDHVHILLSQVDFGIMWCSKMMWML